MTSQNTDTSLSQRRLSIEREPRISPLASDESGVLPEAASHKPWSRLSLPGRLPETPLPPAFSQPGTKRYSQSGKPLKVRLYASPPTYQSGSPGTGDSPAKETEHTHTGATFAKSSGHSSSQGHPSTEALKWNFTVPPLQSPPGTAQTHSGSPIRRPPLLRQSPRARGYTSQPAHGQSLKPETNLFGGRYRLMERQGIQEWLFGAFEGMWLAQDIRRAGTLVGICEIKLPDSASVIARSTLRTATMALHTISRHAHVPALWEVFNEQERSFFVFDHHEGESLLARMRRSGRVLPAQEVIECCLQVTDVLEYLLQMSPPLVHGLIRPEYIMEGQASARCILANFSVILAGGATQFVTGIERSRLSIYTPPEFARGVIDVRSDIYALLASAYYLVTGKAPVKSNGVIPPVRQFNPSIPPQFEAILEKGLYSGKGLRPVISERYQHPAELRHDLLMMHTVSEAATHSAPANIQEMKQAPPPKADSEEPAHSMLQTLAPDIEERVMLLPHPEDLPPLEEANDTQKALFYLISMLVCLILVIFVGRRLV